jgi:hypothetical protein
MTKRHNPRIRIAANAPYGEGEETLRRRTGFANRA